MGVYEARAIDKLQTNRQCSAITVTTRKKAGIEKPVASSGDILGKTDVEIYNWSGCDCEGVSGFQVSNQNLHFVLLTCDPSQISTLFAFSFLHSFTMWSLSSARHERQLVRKREKMGKLREEIPVQKAITGFF
ncbi:hypothetical protein QYF36_016786 [Acer negundo]|nr:hypothetical protein QYF36_007845 [Acer negundo]KAK4840733.1 hypothetical protein QYF36_016786 [Acer negundo]